MIRCKLKDTGLFPNSPWNKSLDGLEGEIISGERTGYGGYSVDVKLDTTPEWLHRNIVHTYLYETTGRDLIAEIDEKDYEKFMNSFIRPHIKEDLDADNND